MRFYDRSLTTVAQKIKKGDANKQIMIHTIMFTASTTGTVAITDGKDTFTFDVMQGVNEEIELGLVFAPDSDVTITPTGPTLTTLAEYTYK